jgi:hypothetical protein
MRSENRCSQGMAGMISDAFGGIIEAFGKANACRPHQSIERLWSKASAWPSCM